MKPDPTLEAADLKEEKERRADEGGGGERRDEQMREVVEKTELLKELQVRGRARERSEHEEEEGFDDDI